MKIDYIKNKDIIILQFPTDIYDVDAMQNIAAYVRALFPDNDVLCLPANISFSLLKEENPFL